MHEFNTTLENTFLNEEITNNPFKIIECFKINWKKCIKIYKNFLFLNYKNLISQKKSIKCVLNKNNTLIKH